MFLREKKSVQYMLKGGTIYEKFYLGCYVKCLVLKTKTLKFLQIFTAHSYDTTQFSCFLAVVMHFRSFYDFSGLKILKILDFFNFKTWQILKGFEIHRKFFPQSFEIFCLQRPLVILLVVTSHSLHHVAVKFYVFT